MEFTLCRLLTTHKCSKVCSVAGVALAPSAPVSHHNSPHPASADFFVSQVAAAHLVIQEAARQAGQAGGFIDGIGQPLGLVWFWLADLREWGLLAVAGLPDLDPATPSSGRCAAGTRSSPGRLVTRPGSWSPLASRLGSPGGPGDHFEGSPANPGSPLVPVRPDPLPNVRVPAGLLS